MAYIPITWVNNSTPAINATNLNHIETGIDEAHDCANILYTPFGDIIATDVQDAISELEDKKISKATLNANSIVKADTDDTPIVLAVAEQTLVGRITAGTITDLSTTQVRELINVEDNSQETSTTHVNTAGAVMETDYNAHTILVATADDTPIALGIGTSELVGRTAAGNVDSLTMVEARGILNVEDAADVTDAVNIASSIHGVASKTTPTNDDEIGIIDSDAADVLKKLTWTNVKLTLKTYFDALYASIGANSDITSLTGLTTPLDETYGGTGTTTYLQGDVLYASGVDTLSKLGKGTADQVLTMNSGATAPEWAAGGDMLKSTYDPNDDGIIAVSQTEATLYPDTGEQAFLDADHTKLNGIEALADVTDAVNVASAGAMFDVSDDLSPQLGGDLDLNGHDIIIDTTPPSDHTYSGIKGTFTNGNSGSVAFGDVCYMAADGHMEFADADASTTMPGLYMALGTITAASSGEWLIMGVARDDTWNWTIGPGAAGLIYVSLTGTTANTLTQTAPSATGDQVQIVGHALSADSMMFNPSPVIVEIA